MINFITESVKNQQFITCYSSLEFMTCYSSLGFILILQLALFLTFLSGIRNSPYFEKKLRCKLTSQFTVQYSFQAMSIAVFKYTPICIALSSAKI